MGSEWTYRTLSDCGRWLSGGTPSKRNSAYWNGDIPWISAKAMRGSRFGDSELKVTELGVNNGTKIVPENSILLLVRGSMLHQHIPVGITTKEVSFNQDVKAIIPNTDFVPKFLLYWFLANEPLLLSKVENTGIGAGKLDTDVLHAMSIPCPPLPTQRAIAHILGSLDDKIELNRQMNRTLGKMAQAIFKSWFIDFDPVRAKADGHNPGLPKEIADLFPDSFKDSELGPIPKGWKVKALDKIAEYFNGLACQKYPAVSGESSLPVIKIRELRQGISSKTDRATPNVPEKFLVSNGDVLFSWSGSLLVDVWTGGPGVLNQHVFKVTSNAFPKWFYFLWTTHHLKEFQKIAADKSGRRHAL